MNPDTQIGSSGGAFPIGQPENKGYTINKEGYLEIAGKRCVVKKNGVEIKGNTDENIKILETAGRIFSNVDQNMESGDVWKIIPDNSGKAEIQLNRQGDTRTIRQLRAEEKNELSTLQYPEAATKTEQTLAHKQHKPLGTFKTAFENFSSWVSSVKNKLAHLLSGEKTTQVDQPPNRKSMSASEFDTQSESLGINEKSVLRDLLATTEDYDVSDDAQTIDELEIKEMKAALAAVHDSDVEVKDADSEIQSETGNAKKPESLLVEIEQNHKKIAEMKACIKRNIERKYSNLKKIPKLLNAIVEAKMKKLATTITTENVSSKNTGYSFKKELREVHQKLANNYIALASYETRDLEALSSQLRVTLRNGIASAIGNLQLIINKTTDEQEKAELRKNLNQLTDFKAKLEAIAKTKANEHLLTVLQGKADPIGTHTAEDLRNAVIVSGASLVDATTLFTLITQALTTTDQKTELLHFCQEWLKANAGAKGFEEAKGILENFTKEHPEEIYNPLRAALAQPPITQNIPVLRAGEKAFMDVLNAVKNNTLDERSYAECVSQVTQDLRKMQGQFYSQFTPSNLFKKKWANDRSLEEKASTENFNKMANYLQFLILSNNTTPEQRVQLIKFLIDIAHKAYESHDIATSYVIIMTALGGTAVLKLKAEWEMVCNSPSHKEKIDALNKIYAVSKNSKEYRDKVAALSKTTTDMIPNVAPYATDLIKVTEGNPALATNAETYNFEKRLLPCVTILSTLLSGQEAVKKQLSNDPVLNTDLLAKLNAHESKSDAELDNMAKGITG